jgi:hypothetical protein
MPTWGVVAFIALFVGVAVLVFVAANAQQKRWLARPAILRAFASRRGFRVVENPGKPSDLVPIRPLEKAPHLTAMQLPVAVNGRTLDSDFTLFDVYTEKRSGFGNNRSYIKSYETFITIKADGQQWPHFEFAAMSHSREGSLEAALLAVAGSLAEAMMKDRGLVHVPTPDHPGYQLFAESAAAGEAIRDALVPLFEKRSAWWIGGLGDALTLQHAGMKSGSSGSLIDEKELDRFVDEAVAIERATRAAMPA